MDDISESTDPLRWCIYCGADCYLSNPDHASDCPTSTGVYEVQYENIYPPCEHCGKRPDPSFLCSECECALVLGDHFTHRQIGEDVYEPICLGCAAQEAIHG